MSFGEVLDKRTIVTHLNVNSKAEALDVMAEMFLKANVIGDKEEYLKDVYIREEFGATGIGNYIAIPHGKSESVLIPGIAVAVLDHEIEWESLDDNGAKVVILFAVGADNASAEEHLRLLAMLSKRLGDDTVVSRLIGADTVEDVINAFEENEDAAGAADEEEEELDLDEISIM